MKTPFDNNYSETQKYSKPPLPSDSATPPKKPTAYNPNKLPKKPSGRRRILLITIITIVIAAAFAAILFIPHTNTEHKTTPLPPETAVPALYVEQTEIYAPAEGGKFILPVKYHPYCTPTQAPSWVEISVTNDSIAISIQENPETVERIGTLKITNGHSECTLTLHQKEAVPRENITINRLWTTHNDYVNGQRGLTVHADISFTAVNDRMSISAKFINEDTGTDLWDTNDWDMEYFKEYYATTERVSDFAIFVPYADLSEDNYRGRNYINARINLTVLKASESYAAKPSLIAKESTTLTFNRQ